MYGLLILIAFFGTIQQLDALSCEKAGCQYCSYSKMQQHCSSFCNACSKPSGPYTTSYKVVSPHGQSTRGREMMKYTKPYDRKPQPKPVTAPMGSSSSSTYRPHSVTKPYPATRPHPVTSAPPQTTRKMCDGINPCVPLEHANARFQQCCEERMIKGACVSYCRYDVTREEARFAFMHGKCPFRQLQTYLSCAAQGNDRRDCCQRMGILDGHLAFCEPFCVPDDPSFPGAKPRYQPCADKLTTLMTCFWAGLE